MGKGDRETERDFEKKRERRMIRKRHGLRKDIDYEKTWIWKRRGIGNRRYCWRIIGRRRPGYGE